MITKVNDLFELIVEVATKVDNLCKDIDDNSIIVV